MVESTDSRPLVSKAALGSDSGSNSHGSSHSSSHGDSDSDSLNTDESASKYVFLVYDFFAFLFTVAFNIFFREIQTRGTYKIPRSGPVIFVAAPHSNQFVDPMMIIITVFNESHRRVSFLIAMVSYKLRYIGWLARQMLAIPVGRSQDTLRRATGSIQCADDDPLRIIGQGTKFTSEAKERNYINIPGSGDLAEVKEIISDTELLLKADFKGQKSRSTLSKGSTSFRVADKIDNTGMYKFVFHHLAANKCIGIFPEGGSHDRPDLLPLKAGVAVMALGARDMYPDCDLSIVPVGMNYFHPNKFRSRAVIEFGDPIKVDMGLVAEYRKGGQASKDAVAEMLSQIADSLDSVTINAPDYETLMLVQACQRLYRPNRYVPLPLTIEFTRRFIKGFNLFKDDPRVAELKNEIISYNSKLYSLGIRDHQVPTIVRSNQAVLARLAWRATGAIFLAVLCIPGVTLFSPVFIATKIISMRKAAAALRKSTVKIKAKDVIATWKILVALWLAPTLYTIYSIIACYWIIWRKHYVSASPLNVFLAFGISYVILALISYATLRIGEVGMDIFKTLRSLLLSSAPQYATVLEELQAKRLELVTAVTDIVNDLGPELFPDISERIEAGITVLRDPNGDPRTDLLDIPVQSSSGKIKISDVPVFSMMSFQDDNNNAAESRAGEWANASTKSDPERAHTTGASLNEELSRRIKDELKEQT